MTPTRSDLAGLIDAKDSRPLFVQVQEGLRQMILQGRFRSGEKLPGDQELSQILDVNHRTVRRAMAALVDEGLIRRVRRVGTLVCDDVTAARPTVGFFYYADNEPVMLARAHHLQNYLEQQGYDLKLIGFWDDFYDNPALPRQFEEYNLAGAVIVPLWSDGCRRFLLHLESIGFPYVRFGTRSFTDLLRAPLVTGDDTAEMETVLTYLWQRGHRKIGLLAAYETWEQVHAYRRFYADKPIFQPRWLKSLNFSGSVMKWQENPKTDIVVDYLDCNPDLTAVLVMMVPAALDMLSELKRRDKQVPQDLSLIVMGDHDAFSFDLPSITAIDIAPKRMADAAGELLMQAIAGGGALGVPPVRLGYELIERESVADLGYTETVRTE